MEWPARESAGETQREMSMDDLNFELQLETDLLKLFDFSVPGKYAWTGYPERPVYPSLAVRCDRVEPEDVLGAAGVYSADLLIYVQSYRADDVDGAALRNLLNQVRGVLFAPDLAERLNAASGCTVFAAENLEGYGNPDPDLRSLTLQLRLKFSPAK